MKLRQLPPAQCLKPTQYKFSQVMHEQFYGFMYKITDQIFAQCDICPMTSKATLQMNYACVFKITMLYIYLCIILY